MSDTAQDFSATNVETKGGVVAYLNVDGAIKAGEFYVKAFDATLAAQMPADDNGRSMHVHLYVNGSSVMLSDFYPEHGHTFEKPQAFSLTLMVDDINAWHARAVAAGATSTQAPEKMFWGDYYGEVVDPFGVRWAFNQPG